MLRNLRLNIFVMLAGLCFSCVDDDLTIPSEIQSTTVLNSEISALTARIKFSLVRDSGADFKYWPASGDESAAVLITSAEKKKNHTVAIFNLKESTAYNYRVIVKAQDNTQRAGEIQTFTTAAMPAWLKSYYNEGQNNIQETLPGYYLLVPSVKPNGLLMLDKTGKIAWYWSPPERYTVKTARFTSRNSVIMLLDESATQTVDGNIVLETSLAGDTLSYFRMGEKGFDKTLHHDIQLDSKGNLIGITKEVKDNLPGDGLLVLDSQGNKIWSWSTFDELTDIDPDNYTQPSGNSLVIDKDNNYIVSFRALSQIWKINSSTGDVMWKLGKDGNVEMPEGTEFQFQHFAHRNSQDEIMLLDNGSAERPTSRVLSFLIDENNLEAAPRINAILPGDLYSPAMGSAMLLPDGNVLTASASNGKLVKTDQNGSLLWTLQTAGPIDRAEYWANPFGK